MYNVLVAYAVVGPTYDVVGQHVRQRRWLGYDVAFGKNPDGYHRQASISKSPITFDIAVTTISKLIKRKFNATRNSEKHVHPHTQN